MMPKITKAERSNYSTTMQLTNFTEHERRIKVHPAP